MRILEEKAKPIQNISFMAIMAAITAVFSLLIAFWPELSVGLVFFLPILSALVGYTCLKRYLPAYLIAACALSLAVASFNIGESLFIVIPSILIGALLGLALKIGFGNGITVFLMGLLQMGVNCLIVVILKATISLDPISTFYSIFGVETNERIVSLTPSLVFAIALAQCAITNFIFSVLFLNKLNKRELPTALKKFLEPSLGLLFGALAMGLGTINLMSGSLFLVASLFFSITCISLLFNERRIWVFIAIGVLLLAVFFIRAAISNIYKEGLILYSLFGMALDFLVLFSNLLKGKAKDEIS